MKTDDSVLDSIVVVKRNGSKVDFNASKIALAIKKGFDGFKELDEEENELLKYTEDDIQKVFKAVVKKIKKDYSEKEKIKIEEIQDIIEEQLTALNYEEVSKAFAEYREKRAQSRAAFIEDKRSHKFLKTLEGLALKNAAEDDKW